MEAPLTREDALDIVWAFIHRNPVVGNFAPGTLDAAVDLLTREGDLDSAASDLVRPTAGMRRLSSPMM